VPTKPAIDIDPDLLRGSAAAQLHAAAEGWNHVNLESTGHVPTILKTLVPEGPWAWAIMTYAQPDGSIALPVHTSFDGIEEMYKMIRGHSDVVRVEPILEIRGEWYSFHEDIATSREKATGTVTEREMVLVLPVTSGPGITGELAWVRMDRALLGKDLPLAEPKSPLEVRRHMLGLHDQFLDALRRNDAAGMTATFSEGCQSALRDYVDDTGTITGLDDLGGLQSHYEAFFDTYQVRTVDILQRVIQDWYLFAEVRVEAVRRADKARGRPLAFHTASLFVPGKEDKFIVYIGHGTDIADQPAS
jgi:hypothetical protein